MIIMKLKESQLWNSKLTTLTGSLFSAKLKSSRFWWNDPYVCCISVLPCMSGPCQNAGTCNDKPGGTGFMCQCPTTHTGTTCETCKTKLYLSSEKLFKYYLMMCLGHSINLVRPKNNQIQYNVYTNHAKLWITFYCALL